jgi:hypothetical protein
MKRALVVVGLITGAMLGFVLVALNPLSLVSAPPARGTPALGLTYDPAGFRGFELTPLALVGVAAVGAGGAGFADPAIRYVSVAVAPVTNDANAAVGLAVRMSSLARQNSLAGARLGLMTNMSVAWPDQGSFFLAGSENLWPIVRDCLWSLLRGRGFKPAQGPYALAPVPGGGTGQAVSGARGTMSGARGSYSETFESTADRDGGLAGKRRLFVNELR